ncbi:hypothetical protein KY289_013517 [Solanum tuberosum]|nr:hypothetical protein KY289_013517 [Solanum tuberosum]
MWTLWKRRNARKHGGDINFHNMVLQVQTLIRQLIVMWFPWMNKLPDDWPTMVQMLRMYKPKLYYQSVAWRPPEAEPIGVTTNMEAEARAILEAVKRVMEDSIGDGSYIPDNYQNSLANRAYEQEGKQIYNNIQELPSICRKILNADESQNPNIRIKTRKTRGNIGQFSSSH